MSALSLRALTPYKTDIVFAAGKGFIEPEIYIINLVIYVMVM